MAYARIESSPKVLSLKLPDAALSSIHSFLFYPDSTKLAQTSKFHVAHTTKLTDTQKATVLKTVSARTRRLDLDELIAYAVNPLFRHEIGPNPFDIIKRYYPLEDLDRIQTVFTSHLISPSRLEPLHDELIARCQLAK
ncbi:MAG: hypothetical protein Q7V63_01145 [Gammaproteobacteria bacterium]|nr:hypothetical protein [Gammaproteobacteria bacterium]